MNDIDFNRTKKQVAKGQKKGIIIVSIVIVMILCAFVAGPEICINPITGEDCSLLAYALAVLKTKMDYLM